MTLGETRYQPVFRTPGDWVAMVAVIPFLVSAFALEWVVVRVRIPSYVPLIGGIESRSLKTSVGLLDIPWFWVLVLFLILAAFLVCFFLVRTRGAVTLGAGVLFLLFAVVFFFGAWYKINAIVGDLMNLFTDIPFIGPLLKESLTRFTKDALVVSFQPGYYLFIASGAMLAIGGALRLFFGPVRQERAGAALPGGGA